MRALSVWTVTWLLVVLAGNIAGERSNGHHSPLDSARPIRRWPHTGRHSDRISSVNPTADGSIPLLGTQGPVLQGIVLPQKPWAYLNRVPENGVQATRWVGFEIDLLTAAALEGGFRINLTCANTLNEVKDSFLSSTPSPVYSIGVGHLSVLGQFTTVPVPPVKFSHVYMQAGLQLLLSADLARPKDSISGLDLLKVFDSGVVIFLLLTTVVMLILFSHLIWLFERTKNPEFSWGYTDGIVDAMWWGMATVTTVGYGDKAPRTQKSRLLGGVWMLLGMFLMAFLTAEVSSQLNNVRTKPAVNSIDGLPDRNVGALSGSSAELYLREHGFIVQPFNSISTAWREVSDPDSNVNAILLDSPDAIYISNVVAPLSTAVVGPILQAEQYAFLLNTNFSHVPLLEASLLRVIRDRPVMRAAYQAAFLINGDTLAAHDPSSFSSGGGDVDFIQLLYLLGALVAIVAIVSVVRYKENQRKAEMWKNVSIDENNKFLGHGKELTKEQAQELFEEVDTDSSGDIGLDEIRELVQRLGVHVDDRALWELMRSADQDGSGTIEFAEFWKLVNKIIRQVVKHNRAMSSVIVRQSLDDAPQAVTHMDAGDEQLDKLMAEQVDIDRRVVDLNGANDSNADDEEDDAGVGDSPQDDAAAFGTKRTSSNLTADALDEHERNLSLDDRGSIGLEMVSVASEPEPRQLKAHGQPSGSNSARRSRSKGRMKKKGSSRVSRRRRRPLSSGSARSLEAATTSSSQSAVVAGQGGRWRKSLRQA